MSLLSAGGGGRGGARERLFRGEITFFAAVRPCGRAGSAVLRPFVDRVRPRDAEYLSR